MSAAGARRHRLRTDAALLRGFRAGDEAAFSALHARYADGIRSYAAYMLRGSAHDPDDAAQDVFLRAYQALRRDERDVDVRPWLFRIAHNRCIDVLRRPVGAELDDRAAGGVVDAGRGAGDPAVAIEQREAMRALLRDIGTLTDGQRSALLLRELGGLSHEAVAEALGISATSSRMLVHRARVALTDAAEARDTACHDVRERLVAATDLGGRLARRDRRHLHACAECRAFRRAHAGMSRELALLAPGGLGLGGVLKVFGGGGIAAGGGGAVATAGSTSVMSAGAAKLAVGACCALLAGGGAAVGLTEATTSHHRDGGATAQAAKAQRPEAKAGARTPPRREALALPAIPAAQRHAEAPKPHTATTLPASTPVSDSPTAKPPPRDDPRTSIDLTGLDGGGPDSATPSQPVASKHSTTIDLADFDGG